MTFSDESEQFSDEENISLETILIEGIQLHNLTFQLTNYDFTCSNLSHPIWTTSGLSEANLDDISTILEPHKQSFIKYLQNLNIQINEFIQKVDEITALEHSYLNKNDSRPKNRIIGKIHDDIEYFFVELTGEVKGYISQNVLLKVYTNELLSHIIDHYFTKDHEKLCCGIWKSCWGLAKVRICRLICHYNETDITEESTNLSKMLNILNSEYDRFGETDFVKSIKTEIKTTITQSAGNLLASCIFNGLTNSGSYQVSHLQIIKSIHDNCFGKLRIISGELTNRTKIFNQPPNYTPNRRHIRKEFRWQDDITNEMTEKLNTELVEKIQKYSEDILVAKFLELSESYNDGAVVNRLNYKNLPDEVRNLVARSVAKFWLKFGIAEIVKNMVASRNSNPSIIEVYSISLIELDSCLSKTDLKLIDSENLKSVLDFSKMLIMRFTTEIENASEIKISSSVNPEGINHLSELVQGIKTIKPILINLLKIFDKIDDTLEMSREQWVGFNELVDLTSSLESDFIADQVNDKLNGFYDANARRYIQKANKILKRLKRKKKQIIVFVSFLFYFNLITLTNSINRSQTTVQPRSLKILQKNSLE